MRSWMLHGHIYIVKARRFCLLSTLSLLAACQAPVASDSEGEEEESAPSIDSSKIEDSDDEPTPSQANASVENPQESLPDEQADADQSSSKKAVNCDIDFLFVVDNSQSMATKQKNLAASVPKFVETLVDELKHEVDYHLGVVTTDAYQGNPEECRQLGALVTSTAGRESSGKSCGPYGPGRAYMTRDDAVEDSFPCAARPGIDGEGLERVIDSLRGALSPEMQKEGACNEGFLRKDAILVTVIISDEDDGAIGGGLDGVLGSKGDPESWHQDIMAIKGGDETHAVTLGLLGLPMPNLCTEGGTFSQDAKRLREFVGNFKHHIVADVCAENYDPFFDKAISMIDLACEEVAPPQ